MDSTKFRGLSTSVRNVERKLAKIAQESIREAQAAVRRQLGAGCQLLFAIGAVGDVHCLFGVHGEAFGEVPVTEHEGRRLHSYWKRPRNLVDSMEREREREREREKVY
jgi:hypothetical protein